MKVGVVGRIRMFGLEDITLSGVFSVSPARASR
jgi:hypothetical protein